VILLPAAPGPLVGSCGTAAESIDYDYT